MRRSLTLALFFLSLATTAFAGEVRISAASSMTNAVKALIVSYAKQVPNITFQTNFASSGTLARQILVGAPTDLFISANPMWMDFLIDEQRIKAESVSPLAGNTLVLVGNRKMKIPNLDAIVGLNMIAIGNPKNVPAGQYAEQALRAAGLFDRLQGKLVMAKDARQALIYADRGETDAAFVYRSDALLAENAIILLDVPQTLYAEIIYPVGLTNEGVKNPDADAFLAFLKTDSARSVLTKFGFRVK